TLVVARHSFGESRRDARCRTPENRPASRRSPVARVPRWPSMPSVRTRKRAKPAAKGIEIPRFFTRPDEDPLATVAWERRTARIEDAEGEAVFEQKSVEVPASWGQLAT